MMHIAHHGVVYTDDKKVMICDVLKEKGQKMYWTYDLGDQFVHTIEVTEVRYFKRYMSCSSSSGVCA